MTDDPQVFADAAGGFLAREPERHSVFLTTLGQLLTGYRYSSERMHFAWYDAGAAGVAAVAMQTPPFPVLLGRIPEALLPSLAAAFGGSGAPVAAVNGDPDTAAAFAAVWDGNREADVEMRQRLYRLGELRPPEPMPAGQSRVARDADLDLAAAWFTAFDVEAHLQPVEVDARARMASSVAGGRLRLWEVGGQPVAMAGRTPTEAGIARVGPVYTPSEHRRRGYGTAVTAEVTADALADGASGVVLYTDLANPTSNSIYQQIGYAPVEDRVILRFNPR